MGLLDVFLGEITKLAMTPEEVRAARSAAFWKTIKPSSRTVTLSERLGDWMRSFLTKKYPLPAGSEKVFAGVGPAAIRTRSGREMFIPGSSSRDLPGRIASAHHELGELEAAKRVPGLALPDQIPGETGASYAARLSRFHPPDSKSILAIRGGAPEPHAGHLPLLKELERLSRTPHLVKEHLEKSRSDVLSRAAWEAMKRRGATPERPLPATPEMAEKIRKDTQAVHRRYARDLTAWLRELRAGNKVEADKIRKERFNPKPKPL